MALYTKPAVDVFAPTTSAGDLRSPSNGETQIWGIEVERGIAALESVVTAFTSNGGLIYSTKALMLADLAHDPNTMAWVIADPSVANNGVYAKSGASGVGTWVRKADLPYSFIRMTDAGAGTANAIQVTSAIPTSASVLRVANVYEANGGNVTLSENGAAAKPLLTNSGNQIVPGGLVAGMMIVYLESGSNFRLISDQASAAIQAACEAAQAGAETAAANAIAAAAAIASAPQWSFPTKAAAELFNPVSPPDFILLTGFSTANEFGGAKVYKKVVSMPSHGGKVTLGSTYYEPDTATAVTPAMYGGSLIDALRQGVDVRLSGAMTISAGVGLVKSKLRITSEPGTSITFTGSSGSNLCLHFEGVDEFDLTGPLTIDAGNLAGLCLDINMNAGARVKVHGLQAFNAKQSGVASGGASGIKIYCNNSSHVADSIDVQFCKVDSVTRDVIGGDCSGIIATDSKMTVVRHNKINHVNAGGDTINADAIVVFSQLAPSGVYADAVCEISHNDIRNWSGRAIKTQVSGKVSVFGNLFRIDEAISPIPSWRVTDHQTMDVTQYGNKYDLIVAPLSTPTDPHFHYSQPPTVLPYTRKASRAHYFGEETFATKAFIDAIGVTASRLYFLTAASSPNGLGSVGHKLEWIVESCSARSDQTAPYSIAANAFDASVPNTWASGASLRVVIRNNYVEANHFLVALPVAAGGTAAHGGAGDLSGKLSYELVGNRLPLGTLESVLPYTNNGCFTNDIVVADNDIGTVPGLWTSPFDFSKLHEGCRFYVGGESTPARISGPASPTFGVFTRTGNIMRFDRGAANYYASAAIGAAPTWA